SLVILPGNKVLVGGTIDDGSYLQNDFFLLQLDAKGAPDKSFNGNGFVTVDFGNRPETLRNLSVTYTGLIVAGGPQFIDKNLSTGGINEDLAIAVFSSNGTLYRTFD